MMQTGIYMLLFYCNRSVPDHDTWYTLSKNMERVILWWIYSDIDPMYCLQLDGRMQSLSAKSTSPFDQECVASFPTVSTDCIYCPVDNREWAIVQENVYPFRREGYFLVFLSANVEFCYYRSQIQTMSYLSPYQIINNILLFITAVYNNSLWCDW